MHTYLSVSTTTTDHISVIIKVIPRRVYRSIQ